MPGRPKRELALAALEQLAHSELGPESTPLDWAVDQIAAATTMRQMGLRIAEHTDGWVPSRGWLSGLLKSLAPDAAERIEQARVESAEALVERATETLDAPGVALSRETLAQAKHLADIDLWLAARRDRAKFGDTPTVQIGISAGSLHLDALRAVQPGQSRPALMRPETPAVLPASPQEAGSDAEAVPAQESAA